MVDGSLKANKDLKGEVKKPNNNKAGQVQGKGPEGKKDPKEIPVLKYGANNNFHKFKESLSTVALMTYGDLGRLIELEKYYVIPVPRSKDYEHTKDAAVDAKLYEKALDLWLKRQEDMTARRPQLYAMIWCYLSLESKDKVKGYKDYEVWSQEKDPEKLWQAVVEIHKVHSSSTVSEVKKRSAWTLYANCRQGGWESLVAHRERHAIAYKNYTDEGNPTKDDKSRAMDFFDGLDPIKYGDFKNHILNCLDTGTMQPAADVSVVYGWASNWRKTNGIKERLGTATTFTAMQQEEEGKTKSPAGDGEGGSKKKNVKCYKCGKKGHYSNKCKENKPEEGAESAVNATWMDANAFHTSYTVCSAMDGGIKVARNEVLLDNQADISLFHPSVLEAVQSSERKIKVNGVGGYQMTVEKEGYLPNFFNVYCSEEVKVNVLSFAEVEDVYDISYLPGEGFVVRVNDEKEVVFKRRNKLYVANIDEVASIMATVQEMEQCFSKEQVRRAKEAHNLLKNAGYPGPEELAKMLNDGNVLDMPGLTRDDIRRAYEIYGPPPEYIRGKLTNRKVGRVTFDASLRSDDKDQVLWSDVMHIDGEKFFVTVCDPLQITMQNYVRAETADDLGGALQDQLGVLRERGFKPTLVYVDPHSALLNLRAQFPGVVIDPSGAGDHVPKVDVRIRRLKETYRTVKSGLPWRLPKSRVKDLVAYCVSRSNLRGTSALHGIASPRVLLTGVKPTYRKELTLAFGDYVEVHLGTDNMSKERSTPCIALYPVGNSTGAWLFWNLSTGKTVRRSTWVKMVSNDLVIQTINAAADAESTEPVGGADASANEVPEEGTNASEVPEEVTYETAPEAANSSGDVALEKNTFEPESQVAAPVQRSECIALGVARPERYREEAGSVNATFVGKDRWQEGPAAKAIDAEVKQLFKELQALEPVMQGSIRKGASILSCHTFLIEKFLANGSFDKMKARLVSHGNEQNRGDFPDRSSPTVAVHSVMSVLSMFAGKNETEICKVDVKGAFIQTPMEGPSIYMRIGKDLVHQIIRQFPEYKGFVTKKGMMYVAMKKAMYGCVQASILWHRLLIKVLKGIGFEQSEVDPCILKKVVKEFISIILVYVDDLLILGKKIVVDLVIQRLEAEFKWLTLERGVKEMSYLGMRLIREKECFILDMQFYLQEVLKDVSDLVRKNAPGDKKTFAVESGTALNEKERQRFHTTTVKLLYLAKRSRPDILTVVSFLCTRVTQATEDDKRKLDHLLGYLHATRDKVLLLNRQNNQQIQMFVDAAYGLHTIDGKSHTGVIISLGGTVVFVSSKKQKCVAKSPTEAELIGLTDNLDLVVLFHEFVEFICNKKVPTPIINEDCKACIDLATMAGGVARTKQMRCRIFRAKEFFDAKKASIRYVRSELMWADGASKSLVQPKFQNYANVVQGTKTI